MCDDFNTPQVLARLFDLSAIINSLYHGQFKLSDLSNDSLNKLKTIYSDFVINILGLKPSESNEGAMLDEVMQLLIDLRKKCEKK